MREITFRALHKDAGTMLFDQIPGDCLRWRSEGQPVIVMQSTGWGDEQQVEVFEGDKVIVILTGKVYTVIWDDIGAGFLFSPDGEDESKCNAIDYYDFEDECSSFGFRVIGSIYDHLLKGE